MKIMRTLRICLRRLRPSVFKGLCLIMSVALLMLGTSLSNLLRLHDSDGMGGTSSWPDKNHNPVQGREVLENFQTNVLYSMDAPIPSHHLNVHQRFDSSGVHWAVQKKSSDSEGANLVKVINSEKKASLWEEERPGLSQVEKNQHAVMHAPLSLEDSQAATSSLNHIFSVLHRLIFDTNLDLDTRKDVRFVKELLNSTSQDTYLSGLLVNALSANTDRDLNTTLSTLLQDEKLRHILLSQNFDYSRLGNLLKTVGSLVQDGISTHIDVLYKDRGIRDKNEGKLSPSVVKKRLHAKLHRLHPKPNYNDANPRKQNPDNLSISNSDGSPIGFSSDDVSEILGMEVEVQRSANERRANILDERRDGARRTVSFSKIVDGIYWSEEVENSIPKGISTIEADQWIARSRTLMVASLEEPDWNRCGRPKNGYAVFADGSEICARYRAPRDRMLQGEILSYWLSRLLSLDNVPPVSLSSVDSMQWITQRYRFQKMGWTSGNHVALIMWVKDMASEYGAKVFIPHFILEAYKQKHPVEGRTLDFYRNVKSDVPDNSSNSNSNSNMNNNNNNNSTTTNNNNNNGVTRTRQTYSVVKTLVLLAQWGSMIIFDYLTGNYDRVASMQDGAETENKPSIIEESIRNLRGSRGGDKLWLIDNESGLLDAYDLLYQSPKNGPRFLAFHKQMLQTMCVFQRRVVKRLQALHRGEEGAHKMLEKYALGKEPLLGELAKDSSYDLFERHFSERLDQVINWIQHCERLAQAR